MAEMAEQEKEPCVEKRWERGSACMYFETGRKMGQGDIGDSGV